MSDRFPSPPPDAIAAGRWRERSREETTAFDAKVVTVEAATLVFEDVALRERLANAIGLERVWRFFVASRLTLSPATKPSVALTGLVANRAFTGFADTLGERGFEGVRRTRDADGDGPAVDDDARTAGYDALCRLDGVSVRAKGWAALRPVGGSYLLVGGAYPTAVREAPDDGATDAIEAAIDPDRFREELFALMRATK
ncbi:hypothetical protein [Halobaculum limi]|uniref:hypothetical protein n=1 Tax=Halobaculum limi TaxID=3031916 RepID=UPI002404EABD|nr:hypothetical protein [Halobaculum sp. YSMS11]